MLDFLTWLLAIPVALVTTAFVIEVVVGLLPYRHGMPACGREGRAVVLMPAHDEAAGIGDAIAALLPSLGSKTRLVVVADNCSDETAIVARSAGAEVIERHDPSLRGKVHALASGRQHLQSAPPEVIVILDADCTMAEGSLARLVDACLATGRPAQASNLLVPDLSSPPMVQVSNFAFFLKNSTRQRGLRRMGAPALLNGTGMAMPWPLFELLDLETNRLAEDLEFGLDLAARDHPPLFVSNASVWSPAASASAMTTQRSRWEGGFMATAARRGIPLIAQGLRSRSFGRTWLGIHLLTPPLTLLAASNLFALALSLIPYFNGGRGPFAWLLITATAAFGAVIGAWFRGGRHFLTARAAVKLPLYAAWKIPLYWRMVTARNSEWVRTRRD